MAYTPINWQTGDTITADKLNRCDNGWSVESSSQTFFTETVTTALDPEYPDDPAWGNFAYSTSITAGTVTVTFDGTDYVCQKIDANGETAYGGWGADGPDFTSLPFVILSGPGYNSLGTPAGGTHVVSVVATSQVVEKSENFSKAVGYWYEDGALFSETVTTISASPAPQAMLSYEGVFESSTLAVEFDGTSFEVPLVAEGTNYIYGEIGQGRPSFANYPFMLISSTSGANTLYTETAGQHAIVVYGQVLATSEDFRKAIGSPGAFEISLGVTTFAEANEAFLSGKRVYVLEATSTEAYQCQVIYVDISRHTMSALVANGVNVNLRTFSASSADGVLNS